MKRIEELTVLVAEDNEFERDLIVRILNNLEVKRVTACVDGAAALQVMRSDEGENIDVLLCDLKMPGTDGVQLLRQVATEHPALAVIIFSVLDERLRGSVERMAQELSVFIVGNLGKPVTPEKLLPLLSAIPDRLQAGLRQDLVEVHPDLSTEELRAGLGNDEFFLEFQPAVEVATGTPVGAEALLRWNHPVHGLIPPDAFIPLAESTGVIDDITFMLFSKAAHACKKWKAEGLDYRVAVNVSARTLHALDLPERIHSLIVDSGLSSSQFIVEVTESGFMEELGTTLDVSSRLRMKDIELSIDDFGTGYSSLQQLQRIPFNELKIDRSFLAKTAEARVILEASIELGKKLGLTTVVEGVETQEDWNLVSSLHADIAQGYFIARPMAADQLPAWSKEWSARKVWQPQF